MPGVFVPSVTSVAVTVVGPPVWSVTVNVWTPATRAAFGGSTAAGSDEVMATMSVEDDRVPVGVGGLHGDA